MKNSKNKILAALAFGVIAGSVGTSIVGKFQASSNVASTSNKNNSTASDSEVTANVDIIANNYSTQQGETSLGNVETVDVTDGKYVDGTYEGTSSGYASNLKVQVLISSGQITDVQVVSHNETPGFFERAIETVPAEIIQSQSTNVDTASGATYTSIGIINAVNDALSSAQS